MGENEGVQTMDATTVNEQITLLRISIGKIDTKIDGLLLLDTKLDVVSNVANKALDSTSSAHKRIDTMVTTLRWLIGICITGTALMLTIATFVYNLRK